MRNLISIICCFISLTAIAQVGIGTDDPKGALDVTTTNNTSIVLPRVTNVESVTDGNANPPLNGSVVYDISRSATCFYQNDHWTCIMSDGDGDVELIPIPEDEYIKASNTDANDRFGFVVDLSDDGNTLAVTALIESSNATGVNGNQTDNSISESGAVYIFTRSGITWSQQAYIKASNTDMGDWFGRNIALSGDGNTLAVSTDLEDSNAIGINGDQTDNSASNSGAAYVFTRSGTTWSQQAYIKASNTQSDDRFGWSIAISSNGDTIAVGAPFEDGGANGSGAAYIFTRSGTMWSQQAYVKPSNSGLGDQFGTDISISDDGNTLAVGAIGEDSATTGINGDETNNSVSNSGAVYIFILSGTTWSQQAYVKASNTEFLDQFGDSLDVSGDGNTLAVSAKWEDSNATGINGDQTDNSSSNSGAIYIFTRSGTTWSQQAYIKASNADTGDFLGELKSIDLSNDGNLLAVGAKNERSNATGINGNQNDNSLINAGAVYIFSRSGSIWTQRSYVKASNTNSNDQFGSSITISGNGNTLAVGAQEENSNATGISSDQTNNSAPSAGAVYIPVGF